MKEKELIDIRHRHDLLLQQAHTTHDSYVKEETVLTLNINNLLDTKQKTDNAIAVQRNENNDQNKFLQHMKSENVAVETYLQANRPNITASQNELQRVENELYANTRACHDKVVEISHCTDKLQHGLIQIQRLKEQITATNTETMANREAMLQTWTEYIRIDSDRIDKKKQFIDSIVAVLQRTKNITIGVAKEIQDMLVKTVSSYSDKFKIMEAGWIIEYLNDVIEYASDYKDLHTQYDVQGVTAEKSKIMSDITDATKHRGIQIKEKLELETKTDRLVSERQALKEENNNLAETDTELKQNITYFSQYSNLQTHKTFWEKKIEELQQQLTGIVHDSVEKSLVNVALKMHKIQAVTWVQAPNLQTDTLLDITFNECNISETGIHSVQMTDEKSSRWRVTQVAANIVNKYIFDHQYSKVSQLMRGKTKTLLFIMDIIFKEVEDKIIDENKVSFQMDTSVWDPDSRKNSMNILDLFQIQMEDKTMEMKVREHIMEFLLSRLEARESWRRVGAYIFTMNSIPVDASYVEMHPLNTELRTLVEHIHSHSLAEWNQLITEYCVTVVDRARLVTQFKLVVDACLRNTVCHVIEQVFRDVPELQSLGDGKLATATELIKLRRDYSPAFKFV